MQLAVHKLSRVLSVFGAILAVGFIALTAVPLTSATATSSSGQMSDRVAIELRGRVMPRCNFSGSDASITIRNGVSPTDLVQVRRSFQVNCNAPFVMGMSSEHGGLQRASASLSLQPPLGYEASLKVLTDSGRIIFLTCDDGDLKPGEAGCTKSSGDDTAIGKEALLTVRWSAEKQLMPGSYSDELYLNFYIQD